MTSIKDDFTKYALSKGIGSLSVDSYAKDLNNIKNRILTPYILEERSYNVTSLDLFSKLLYERILYFNGEVDSESSNITIAQLLYLSSIDDREINIYINSPGGSVVDGLGIIDTMNYISNPISTTCIGMAASMAAVLLSNGDKGKRFILPHGRVMIHSVASGFKGHTADIKIEMEQTIRCQNDVYEILAKNTDKEFSEIEKLCDRDNWFIGKEAVDLGIVDKVLDKRES